MSPEEQAKYYRELAEHMIHAGNTLTERVAELEKLLSDEGDAGRKLFARIVHLETALREAKAALLEVERTLGLDYPAASESATEAAAAIRAALEGNQYG